MRQPTFEPKDYILVKVLLPGHPRYSAKKPYELAEDLLMHFPVTSGTLKVDQGFILDFASIPRWLTWWIPRVGAHSRAAAIHDFLYEYRLTDRAIADATFLAIMKQDGVRRVRAYLMYAAVRAFGWIYW